jgi:hypothetical protein
VGGPEVFSVAGVGEKGGDGWGGDVVYLVGEVVVLGAGAEVLEDGFADEGVLVGGRADALWVDEEVDVYGRLDISTFLDYEVLVLELGVCMDALGERAVDGCCED